MTIKMKVLLRELEELGMDLSVDEAAERRATPAIVVSRYARRAERIAKSCGYDVRAIITRASVDRARGHSVGVLIFDSELSPGERFDLQQRVGPVLNRDPGLILIADVA